MSDGRGNRVRVTDKCFGGVKRKDSMIHNCMKDLRNIINQLLNENKFLRNELQTMKDLVAQLTNTTKKTFTAINHRLPSCPKGHQMNSEWGAVAGFSHHNCDKCADKLAHANGGKPLEKFYRCSQCDYDLCINCTKCKKVEEKFEKD